LYISILAKNTLTVVKIIEYKSEDLSPGIHLDKELGIFYFSGTSCPENALEFYDPVLNWFDEYIEDPLQNTELDFKMHYFNSITAKIFLMIMSKLEELPNQGYDVKIRWHYDEDEEDMIEAGEDFESILDIEFEMIPYEDELIESEEEYFDDLLDDIL